MPKQFQEPFKDESEVIAFINKHRKTQPWVDEARKNSKKLRALVTGEKFKEVLITKIEQIESERRQVARKRYSKDIRDMFERIFQPRQNVFSASGGSVSIKIDDKKKKDKFLKTLANFKGQKPIKKYLAESYFQLVDTDPNGVIFLEYFKTKDIYPAYKAIDDIRYYESKGQLLNVILFEPKQVGGMDVSKGIKAKHIWRVVDAKRDWLVQQDGETFTVLKSFEHPFGEVPGVILSDKQATGSELRYSPVFPIEALAEDQARDKSILTIYKFQHGFPRHWRYRQPCRQCHGTGKSGDGDEICKVCNGKGEIMRNDATDVMTLDLPTDKDDAIVTPDVEGFTSPDFQTWTQYKEDLDSREVEMFSTAWGTERVKAGGNETATGRFIDVQPIMNKLNDYADTVEFIHNTLADWAVNWLFGAPQSTDRYHITYGRRFIIEGPDVILEKYEEARTKGSNNTILDKLLDEYLLSKYQNDPRMLNEANKKRQVEPYVHQSIDQVNTIFGAVEANKKVLFVDFWEQAKKDKPVEELKKDWADYQQKDVENRSISKAEKLQKTFSLISPLVATKILDKMTGQQVLDIIDEKFEQEVFPLMNQNEPPTTD